MSWHGRMSGAVEDRWECDEMKTRASINMANIPTRFCEGNYLVSLHALFAGHFGVVFVSKAL
jgi:hypothetical protein